jgi:uncharacterized protein (DUF2147 family)
MAAPRSRFGSCVGAPCGNVVSLKEPNDPAFGKPRTDRNNPHPTKRIRPSIGVQNIINIKPDPTPDKWTRHVYRDGKTYSASITLVNATTLHSSAALRPQAVRAGGGFLVSRGRR